MNYILIYKYPIGQTVWSVVNDTIVFGKIVAMDSVTSGSGENIKYIIIHGEESYVIQEDMVFQTAELALQYIIDKQAA